MLTRLVIVGVTTLLWIALTLGHASAEKRVALVVGNGAYTNAPRLPNPANDAADIAAALRRAGFETIVGLDLDRAAMERASIAFARASREADVAMFYYSGHAMQFGGINYLMPTDAKLADEADLRLLTKVDDIVSDLQQAKNLRILVLDSCRDNPLADNLRRSLGSTRAASVQRGLAKVDSPQGMIIAYATQAGRTADDGQGRNSPYTAAFLKHIETREEIGTVFRRVSADVYEATRRMQLPELSLSLIGEFYLRGRPTASEPQGNPGEVAALKERLRIMEGQLSRQQSTAANDPARADKPAAPVQAAAEAKRQEASPERYALRTLAIKHADHTIHAAVGPAQIVSAANRCFVSTPIDVPGGRVHVQLVDSVNADGTKSFSELHISFEGFLTTHAAIEAGGRKFDLYIKANSAWMKNVAETPDLLKQFLAGAKAEIVVDTPASSTVRRPIDAVALQKAYENRSKFCRV